MTKTQTRGRLSDTQLRQRLNLHREERLVPFYPAVDRDRGLLRRGMVDALIKYRPISRNGFFAVMPTRLISVTDAVQLRDELDEVLEIIRYSY